MNYSTFKIQHYILGKTLGTGAFGKVKLAQHEISKTNVAIKIINKKKMRASRMSDKIKREIRSLRLFNHANIIRLYEVLDTQQDIFVIMEYVSGGELFDLIAQKGKLQEPEARHYFTQIVAGVEYCHKNLVAHRDLKPENILLAQNGNIKLADFGLSNLMRDGKFLVTSCGSPNYAAPEVIAGKQYCGTQVDTWSSGIILFALLAGYLPFDEDIINKLFQKIKDCDYSMPSHFSHHAKDLIRRIFQADPTKRIKFHELRSHAWLRHDIPMTLGPAHNTTMSSPHCKINEQVFQHLLGLPLNFYDLNQEGIRSSILKRSDYSFVVCYDLLANEEHKIDQNQNGQSEHKGLVFSDLALQQNQLMLDNQEYFIPVVTPEDTTWRYGFIFSHQAQILMTTIYESLHSLDTIIEVKNLDYHIKCFHKVVRSLSNYNSLLELEKNNTPGPSTDYHRRMLQKLKGHKKQKNTKKCNKFSKLELVFSLRIFRTDEKGSSHVVDVQLNRGHPVLFLEFVNKFVTVLRSGLDQLGMQTES